MSEKIRKNIGVDISSGSINALPEIEIVLISDIENPLKLAEGLRALGWRTWKNFRHGRSGMVIYGIIRGGR